MWNSTCDMRNTSARNIIQLNGLLATSIIVKMVRPQLHKRSFIQARPLIFSTKCASLQNVTVLQGDAKSSQSSQKHVRGIEPTTPNTELLLARQNRYHTKIKGSFDFTVMFFEKVRFDKVGLLCKNGWSVCMKIFGWFFVRPKNKKL
jgi:hypothetical protein